MAKQKKVKVLVVDDSALIRAVLTELINSDDRLHVVGAASDPYEARNMIKQLQPDLLTLDIEMPKMNGITFLKNLMRLHPMPVVMVSTLTHQGAPITLEALEIGAVDYLAKPRGDSAEGLSDYREILIDKLLVAAKANIQSREYCQQEPAKAISQSLFKGKVLRRNFICAIGASTGGTEAIRDVLVTMPKESPALVIAQHIPETFSASFARRLDKICAIEVFEAENDQPIKPGCAYLAPGHSHLRVSKSSFGYVCKLDQTARVNRHRPSVEVLFHSVLEMAPRSSMGVILTGMGADGAKALLDMRQNGLFTVAQDQATSVVWGMPGAAVQMGGAEVVLPLHAVGMTILKKAYES